MIELLHKVVENGTPTYSDIAQQLLNGSLMWPEEQIKEFLDGFLNDPYLTRND